MMIVLVQRKMCCKKAKQGQVYKYLQWTAYPLVCQKAMSQISRRGLGLINPH